MNKKFFTTIQMAALVFSIPFELAAGPLIGYFLGIFLKNKFAWPEYVIYILIVIGLSASIMNAVLLVKMMLKINEKDAKEDN